MNLKGTNKLIVIVIFIVLSVGLLPLLAWPLPYEGLDWVQLGNQIYYDTPELPVTPTPPITTPVPTNTPIPPESEYKIYLSILLH